MLEYHGANSVCSEHLSGTMNEFRAAVARIPCNNNQRFINLRVEPIGETLSSLTHRPHIQPVRAHTNLSAQATSTEMEVTSERVL